MSAVLDVLFPSSCVVCEKPPQLVCSGCLPTVSPGKEHLNGYQLTYALPLERDQERLISGLKDRMKLALASELAQYLDLALEHSQQTAPYLLYPPSSRDNFAKRGYNPIEVICSRSKHLQGLSRVKAKAKRTLFDQRGLSAVERKANLADAFELSSGSGRVLIVDDVVTTGSTVLALAAAAEHAGFEVAGICAIARRNANSAPRQIKKA